VEKFERREAWEFIGLDDDGPETADNPIWKGRRGVGYKPVSKGRQVRVHIAGDGSAGDPYVLEVVTPGRWPNLAEIRGALVAFTLQGALFTFAFPYLSAIPFTEPPAVLLLQVSGLPGTEAEQRLKLTGGVQVSGATGGLAPPPPPRRLK